MSDRWPGLVSGWPGSDASYPGTLPPIPVCAVCGHDRIAHHRTDAGRRTYCTVWHSLRRLTRCECDKYKENPR